MTFRNFSGSKVNPLCSSTVKERIGSWIIATIVHSTAANFFASRKILDLESEIFQFISGFVYLWRFCPNNSTLPITWWSTFSVFTAPLGSRFLNFGFNFPLLLIKRSFYFRYLVLLTEYTRSSHGRTFIDREIEWCTLVLPFHFMDR